MSRPLHSSVTFLTSSLVLHCDKCPERVDRVEQNQEKIGRDFSIPCDFSLLVVGGVKGNEHLFPTLLFINS